MVIATASELMKSFLSATKPSEIRQILYELGDGPEVQPGQRFGPLGLAWQFYGGNESNLSTVNIGSKPERSLVERITNGIDAVLEKRAATHAGPQPTTPMEAAALWFGRPPTAYDNGLYKWQDEARRKGYDREVSVVLTTGDAATHPTISIVDAGIGLQPDKFASTILSLQKGNKLNKLYLTGAFGQGGSATLGYCTYTLIVSRSMLEPRKVGFTLIRLLDLGSKYKTDAYAYLSLGPDSSLVPNVTSEVPLELYSGLDREGKLWCLESGTMVRHYGYELTKYHGKLGPAFGNLYTLLNTMMFDPLLPFAVVDAREPTRIKTRTISGSRNRLMSHTIKDRTNSREDDEEVEEVVSGNAEITPASIDIRYHSPLETISPGREASPSIGVEYWVALAYAKQANGQMRLRSQSSGLFVDPDRPIIGTLNGQNQGDMSARILRDLNLPTVARHTVVHINATDGGKEVRNNLFSSTREGFRDSDVLGEITRVLTNMLKENEVLVQIEQELMASLTRNENSADSDQVRNRIADLLRGAGYSVVGKEGTEGNRLVPDKAGTDRIPADQEKLSKRKFYHEADPIPTLDYPEVSYVRIVYPDKIEVHLGDNQIVRVETDANFRFDRQERVSVRSEPKKLVVASKGELRRGRMYWRLKPTDDAEAGDTGTVIVTVTRMDGSQVTSSVPFAVLPAREQLARRERLPIPNFEVIPINPDVDPEAFNIVWSDLGTVEPTMVAYRPVPRPDQSVQIYYSEAFPPFRNQLDKLAKDAALRESFRENYAVWIGYHALLQHQHRLELVVSTSIQDTDEGEMARLEERQRALVATMQVEQALQMAKMDLEARRRKVSGGSE